MLIAGSWRRLVWLNPIAHIVPRFPSTGRGISTPTLDPHPHPRPHILTFSEPSAHKPLPIPPIGYRSSSEMSSTSPNSLPFVCELDQTRAPLVGRHDSSDGGGVAALPAETVATLFNRTVQENADRVALRVKRDGVWVEWTWNQYAETVRQVARALISLNFPVHRSANILAINCPEWLFANIGAIVAGGVGCGIYPTSSADMCEFIAGHSSAFVVFVDSVEQLKRCAGFAPRLPNLKLLVQFSGSVPNEIRQSIPGVSVLGWDEFLSLHKNVPDSVVDDRIRNLDPGQCCSLIYTSGTTGRPKGVMLSHDNVTWTPKAAVTFLGVTRDTKSISFLPLSHVAAQLLDMFGPMCIGSCVSFADADALKGSLIHTLREVKPTAFFGVPRVWEKMQEKMREVGAQRGWLSQRVASLVKSYGLYASEVQINTGDTPFGFGLMKSMFFKPIRRALGFDRCEMFGSGAAPLMKQTQEYFLSLNMHVQEMYGMSECTGPASSNYVNFFKPGSVGPAMNGTEIRIGDHGEVLMRGRHVFLGYLKNPESTAMTIDSDGFLHSGDVGRIDEEGFLFITGRIKELIITAGGENIAPVAIEDTVKAFAPILSNVMVVGDKRKFLSAIVTLKTNVDQDGLPTHVLTDGVIAVLKEHGSTATTVDQAKKCEICRKLIDKAIRQANEQSVSRASVVQKFILVDRDFAIQTGELTSTLKVKRNVVADMYAKEIEDVYSSE